MHYILVVLSLFLRNRGLWRPASVFSMWCDVMRRPCPCLLDRGTTAVSRRLVSVVPCSTRNEANFNLLLIFFPLSFIFKLLATLLLFYIPVIPLTNLILYSLRARSTPSTPYTFSDAFLVFAILKLHGMLNLSSCGNAYTDSVRSVCVVLTVPTADCYRQIISARRS